METDGDATLHAAPCDRRLGEHQCILIGEHSVHQDGLGSTWAYKAPGQPDDPRVRVVYRRARRQQRQAFARGVALALFAIFTFAFVGYVWFSAPTASGPDTRPIFPAPTTAAPAPPAVP